MAISLRGTANSAEIVVANSSEIDITISNLNLADCVSAGEIINEYSASSLLDALGGFEDWIYEGNVSESDVAEWLAERGYKVEKE